MENSGSILNYGQLKGEASSLTSPRQYTVYFGYFDPTYAIPYTNQFNTGTGAAGADTDVPRFKFGATAMNFVSLLVGKKTSATIAAFSNAALQEIIEPCTA